MKVLKIVIAILLLIVVAGVVVYYLNMSPVDATADNTVFVVPEGASYYTVAGKLEEEGLIRSAFFFKWQVRLNKPNELQEGRYELSAAMKPGEIIAKLSSGDKLDPDFVWITFIEGKNMRGIAKTIAQHTTYSAEEVLALLEDEAYLDRLIEEYWFIGEEIKNPEIYYPLEGYLFPSTYEFYVSATIEDIFDVMLTQMGVVLEEHQQEVEASGHSVHELLTLASIVELEAGGSDRAGVAGVFYNRLENDSTLGSDITTYYGLRLEPYERDLYLSEINEENAYNTRHAALAGKLPVSPVCNPSLASILASLTPTGHDYFYFVSDKYGDIHFTRTISEHEAKIQELKDNDMWFEYD